MAVDSYQPAMIAEDFAALGRDFDRYIDEKKLFIVDVQTSYSGRDGFSPEQTTRIWKDESLKAVDQGFDALRVVGEATFALQRPELAGLLVHYENIINQVLFPSYPFKSLCAYEKDRYPPEIIKSAISAHPFFFYNDELFSDNIHYIPPDIYSRQSREQDEVSAWICNVRRNNENIRALRDSELRFRTLFEKAPMSYQSLDENGHFIDVNETWLNVLGYARDEVIGRSFADFLHPDWKEHFSKNFPRFKAVGEVLGVEFKMVKKDGSLILVSFYGKIGKNADNSFQKTHCIFQDITEKKALEEKQHKYARNLEAIFNSAPNILMLVDKDCRIDNINRTIVKTDRRKKNELRGMLCGDVVKCRHSKEGTGCGSTPACSVCPVRTRIEATFRTGKPHREEEGRMVLVSDGRDVSRVFLISTVLLEFDDIPKVLLSMTDITAHRRLEERVLQAQKMESIGNLAGGIAHDFNNLLFPIIGMSELLLEDLPEGSAEHESAREILNAGKRGSGLVKQILSFSRQDEHRKMPLRVQQVAGEAIKLGRSIIPASIDIMQNLQEDCAMVMADPTQLHQIVMNLVTNAFHAVENKPGARISVTVKQTELERDHMTASGHQPGQYVLLSVADNGIGISQANLEKIFEPYFTTKEKGKGTGLGLAMVYGIVKDHDGDIRVYSTVGQGTTVTVYLPLIEPGGESGAVEPAFSLPTGTERIMVVDDEVPIAALIKQTTQRLGYSVTIFNSSLEAFNCFCSDPFAWDLVITDMTMPGMTGRIFAEKMLAKRPDIPIILCTGFSEQISESIARDIGVKGFLMKPVIKGEMARMIRSVLDEAGR